ncbi:hypothetical protein C900_00493 [Fulvivirga imtechensis AK7]|uniref:CHRD domain-containing protein n=1 Tax=Fulvivirga imtechensis AK7 TaxID=1237149 RepID=L8JVC4_9BACT|nr:hypothetical protein [Fulvivirga imtechensis]ELR72991.1 hypothetical protein C900_00493 [Fulvivirga imtechensis AK7]
MKHLIFKNYTLATLFMLLFGFVLAGCDDDDNGDNGGGIVPTGNSETYTLASVSDHDISGEVTFHELSDGTTSVEIDLTGTSSDQTYPAHIHFNSAVEGGDIAVTLTSVDGNTGKSTTIVTEADDQSGLSYEELLEFDGHVNVHLSPGDLQTLVAAGDIGGNELTGESVQYDLASVSDPDIQGVATFQERVNGETLVTIDLDNTASGGTHPAHIHMNTAAEGGDIVVSLNSVNGETGMSMTHVAKFDDGDALTYEALISYDGYINVHQSADNLGTLIAQGDIGQNALTGESEAYDLTAVDVPGVTGTATFHKRANDETLVVIDLAGTTFAGDHPAHIHVGSVAEAPGDIAISLSNVSSMGISSTNITETDEGEAMTYDDLINYHGHINVHLSADDLATLVAQGDVGANVE